MSLLKKTKNIISRYKIRPKKRLSQNFLVEEHILEKMISYASINRDDSVLEIGAGLGFLTELLAERAGHVIAVEIDKKLTKILIDRLSKYENITILNGDIMKINVPEFNKVVSIPPYSISSQLLFWLLQRRFECAVLTFQEEFARRLAAKPGTEDYGRLTVTVYYHAEVELLDFIPKDYFWPVPEVNSMIVRLKPREQPFHVENERIFFNFIRAIFTQKNRKLRNALMPFLNDLRIPKKDAIQIADSVPFHYRRVREMMPEELGLTFNFLFKRLHELGFPLDENL
ncbi:MAG: 16S rRNA (adenine(1518)-N(6)/adenine(1519)-N(6))-dimethyltransferase RsmA [Candidatus Bathyarchaeia archaeon]